MRFQVRMHWSGCSLKVQKHLRFYTIITMTVTYGIYAYFTLGVGMKDREGIGVRAGRLGANKLNEFYLSHSYLIFFSCCKSHGRRHLIKYTSGILTFFFKFMFHLICLCYSDIAKLIISRKLTIAL